LIEWSSVTKTVTAHLLVQLARAGRIDPHAEVRSVFPQIPVGRATLLDLSRHRSGLPTMHSGASMGLLGDPCRESHYRELFMPRVVVAAKQSRIRYGEFHYSNLGYALLGLCIEEACGQSWIELIREWVLPVSQFPTVTVTPSPELQAVPHLLGVRRKTWSMAEGAYRAAGGLWSSFDDLVAYAEHALASDSASGWFVMKDRVKYHTGQARDTGVCVILDHDQHRVGVAHAMLRSPNAAMRFLERVMFTDV
jgi:serine-type D-Ala-D-Ala carboxypeptidase/endopeptidase